jgi:hypothetical protein
VASFLLLVVTIRDVLFNHASPLGFLRLDKATGGHNEQGSCCFTWHGWFRSIADFGGTYTANLLLVLFAWNLLSIEVFRILNATVLILFTS